jgi:hypothetical protein
LAVTTTEGSWEAFRRVVVQTATPDTRDSVLVPPWQGFGVPGTVKVTEPVGVAPAGTSETVAVKVTDCPLTEELGAETRTVSVTDGFADADPLKA